MYTKSANNSNRLKGLNLSPDLFNRILNSSVGIVVATDNQTVDTFLLGFKPLLLSLLQIAYKGDTKLLLPTLGNLNIVGLKLELSRGATGYTVLDLKVQCTNKFFKTYSNSAIYTYILRYTNDWSRTYVS